MEFLKKKLVERCAEQKDLYYSAFEDEITEDVTKHCINSITLGFFETSKNTKCLPLVSSITERKIKSFWDAQE